MTVRQLLAAAAPRDATTAHALALHERLGDDGRLYAVLVHDDLRSIVRPLESLAGEPVAPGDSILLHLSIGRPEVVEAARRRTSDSLFVYFHNVSPADAFDRFAPAFAAELRQGRHHVDELRGLATAGVAPSEFSAAELRAAGFRDVRVVPLAVPPDRLLSVEADPATVARMTDMDGPVHLCVGQLLPHKRHDLVVAAAHVLATHLDPTATVVLAGAQRLAPFVPTIERFIEELRLTNVVVTGEISDGELAAYYRCATTCVLASEHEGFGVPVLEAMAFGRPVIARRFGAVPEVAGDAALLLSAQAGPTVLAEAMTRVARDEGLRRVLVERGRQRVGRYDPGRAVEELLEIVCG